MNKIKYLCSCIPDVEWSGVLFYSIEGSIKNPSEMVCTVEDILPMDKGTQAYTEYDIDERFVEYLMENPQAMGWKVGHIHSHNTMKVFFSLTDMSEVNDNSESHNFYLSLIVNNYMNMVAMIAFRGVAEDRTEEIPYYSLDENGEKYTIDSSEFVIDHTKLYTYECNIKAPADSVSVDSSFIDKVVGIINKAKLKAEKMKNNFKSAYKQDFPALIHTPNQGMRGKKPFEFDDDNNPGHLFDNLGNLQDDFDQEPTDIEQFCMDLFTGGEKKKVGTTILDILEELLASDKSYQQIAGIVMENYPVLYTMHFENDDPNYFIVVTEEVIEMLEGCLEYKALLRPSIENIKSMLTKFIAHEPTT